MHLKKVSGKRITLLIMCFGFYSQREVKIFFFKTKKTCIILYDDFVFLKKIYFSKFK